MSKATGKAGKPIVKKPALDSKKVSDEIDSLFGIGASNKTKNINDTSIPEASKEGDSEQVRKKSKMTKGEEDNVAEKQKKKKQKSSNDEAPTRTVAHHGIIGTKFIISPEAPLERIDAESGLPVYKAHLLKVGEGGGTDLCPFDCDCCF